MFSCLLERSLKEKAIPTVRRDPTLLEVNTAQPSTLNMENFDLCGWTASNKQLGDTDS